jgi:hypothetical protein
MNLILFILIVTDIYQKRGDNTRKPEKEFEMCKFIWGTIFICGKLFELYYLK